MPSSGGKTFQAYIRRTPQAQMWGLDWCVPGKKKHFMNFDNL